MGVYIKGMEMPKSCLFCWLNSMKQCRATGGDVTWAIATRKRRDGCPLIEVPEPHGRLIDADALINDHPRTWSIYDLQRIANAPTIIPASEKEE